MKLFTCLAHADSNKINILSRVLASQESLCDQVHVCVITNITDSKIIDEIHDRAPKKTSRFHLEVYNEGCDILPSPWLLTWVHKKIMLQKFNDHSYTHFMCIEDDMEVTTTNIEYWVKYRELLKPYNIYPSFLRVEWNILNQQWAMVESLRGDSFSISKSPRIDIRKGYSFINLGRTYQGMFLYDRELMKEHIESISFDLFRFIPDWEDKIKNTSWPLGLTESAVFALTHINVPEGCYSRNFVPMYTNYRLVDPACFVHHLPDKYTNIEETDQGKVLVKDIFID